jgi:hypothetical protein
MIKNTLVQIPSSLDRATENVESTGFDMCMGIGSREKISQNSEMWDNVPLLRTCACL